MTAAGKISNEKVKKKIYDVFHVLKEKGKGMSCEPVLFNH